MNGFTIAPKFFSFDINERSTMRNALKIAIREESRRAKRVKIPEACEENIACMSDLLIKLEK